MPNESTNLVYTLAKHPMCALKAKPSASFPTHLPHLVLCCSAVYFDATTPSSIPSYHFLISLLILSGSKSLQAEILGKTEVGQPDVPFLGATSSRKMWETNGNQGSHQGSHQR